MKKTLFILLTIVIQASLFCQQGEPILHLNMEMHTADIKCISVNRQETLLLSCSLDKTAMLWDAGTGELIRIFRIPISYGDQGKLYACALSPDGKYSVMGGWTGEPEKDIFLYFFNTVTGKMIRSISVFNVITDLEFSNDGNYLACSLAGTAGVEIIKMKDFTRYKSLTGYKDTSYYNCFDRSGKMATTSDDGHIRLYDSSFNLVKQVKSSWGNPAGIAFSPDNKRIAVGFDDSTRVKVIDAASLEFLYEPDISGIPTNDFLHIVTDNPLPEVCWSEKGDYLYAGGEYKLEDDVWWRQLRIWNDKGKGGYVDIPGSRNTIHDIKALPDDTIITAGAYPDLMRVKITGERVFYNSSPIFHFNNYHSQYLSVDNSGFVVGFHPADLEDYYTFDIINRSLTPGKAGGEIGLKKTDNLAITDWEDSTAPKLNGKPLDFLQKDEKCRSGAIAKNGKSILFGTSWFLHCLDSSGKKLWQQDIPDTAWSVTVSGNSQVGVVTFGDGTIRWYRMTDGKELLSLFIHSENKKWIIWTPAGYYDCSPGGEEFIGWYVNNGYDKEADFFPAFQFAGTFYRPDIIQFMLEQMDEEKAIALANKKKNIKDSRTISESYPPVVTIISPQDKYRTDKKSIAIKASIKILSEDPVTEVKILVNGRPYDSIRGVSIKSKTGDEKSYTVDLQQGENNISVMARNRNGWSEPGSGTITVTCTAGQKKDAFEIKPTLYILAVGVSDYKNDDYDLLYPHKDAGDFKNIMEKQKGKLYKDVKSRLLVNSNATQGAVYEGLDWIRKETTSKDIAMIFIAGHGVNDSTGRLYYLCYEADIDQIRRTTVDTSEIQYTIENIAGKVLYFMDTCHSGNIKIEGRRSAMSEPDYTGIINELSRAENGAVVFCSSSGKQYSFESKAWNNGAFTRALVEGISGKADFTKSGRITINMLDLYISERVKELTDGKQTPVTAKPDTIRDFPVSIIEQ